MTISVRVMTVCHIKTEAQLTENITQVKCITRNVNRQNGRQLTNTFLSKSSENRHNYLCLQYLLSHSITELSRQASDSNCVAATSSPPHPIYNWRQTLHLNSMWTSATASHWHTWIDTFTESYLYKANNFSVYQLQSSVHSDQMKCNNSCVWIKIWRVIYDNHLMGTAISNLFLWHFTLICIEGKGS